MPRGVATDPDGSFAHNARVVALPTQPFQDGALSASPVGGGAWGEVPRGGEWHPVPQLNSRTAHREVGICTLSRGYFRLMNFRASDV